MPATDRLPASCDVAIVGGGIVGLATAHELQRLRPGTRVVVVEKEARVGAHQTGHNSGVIHSGLYYAPGSLKARTCREGYARLLRFCEEHAVAHEVCGKLVVATEPDEVARLEALAERGAANGLTGIERLGPAGIREREPHCAGVAALRVPQTGIVDYPAMARRLAEAVVAAGGAVRTSTRALGLRDDGTGAVLETDAGEVHARAVVTCAGLQSDEVARRTDPALDLRIIPFRGEYHELVPSARHLVRHLIYPVPDPAFPFLGVHFTRRVDGTVECGPNAVVAFAREGYRKFDVSPRELAGILAWPGFRRVARRHWRTGLGEYRRSYSRRAFVTALSRLVPEIRVAHLSPGGAGVRAQACARDGGLLDDFEIRHAGRVVHVCNAPSPAATASLAIGDAIAQRVLGTLGWAAN
jgi:L-2-hydroxyglutarate oxidase